MADDTSVPMPGPTEFSADEEQAMRAARAQSNAAPASPSFALTAKGRALRDLTTTSLPKTWPANSD